jgi:hypothetical protein
VAGSEPLFVGCFWNRDSLPDPRPVFPGTARHYYPRSVAEWEGGCASGAIAKHPVRKQSPLETGDCHVGKSALLAMTLPGTLQNCRGKCSKVRKNVTRNLSAFVV